MTILTSESLAAVNVAKVLRCLHDKGPLSRAQLSRQLSMSRSASGDLIELLVDSGIATIVGDVRTGRVGRPSRLISVGRGGPYSLCITPIDSDELEWTAVGLNRQVVSGRRARQSALQDLDGLSRFADEVAARLGQRWWLAGVVVSEPTTVDATELAVEPDRQEPCAPPPVIPVLHLGLTELIARGALTFITDPAVQSVLCVGAAPDFEFFLAERCCDGGKSGTAAMLAQIATSCDSRASVGEDGDEPACALAPVRVLCELLEPDVLISPFVETSAGSRSNQRARGVPRHLRNPDTHAAHFGAAEIVLRPWLEDPVQARLDLAARPTAARLGPVSTHPH